MPSNNTLLNYLPTNLGQKKPNIFEDMIVQSG